jgi:hypothetical protein
VSIEPRIGHLKSDFRLGRNFLSGVSGDAINVLLACAASRHAQMAARIDCIPPRFAALADLPAIPRRASLRALKAFFRTDNLS